MRDDLLRLPVLFGMVRKTISDPAGGAEMILSLAVPRAAWWLAFCLMVVLSMLIGEMVALVLGPPDDAMPLAQTPVVLGLLQGMLLFLGVHIITHLGRAFGGTGGFDGALALVSWLQFIFIVLQVVQLALAVVAPPLAGIISILAIALFFWLLSHFITVLHGFSSVARVFFMTLLTFVGLIFTLSLVLTALGLTLPTGAPT